MRWLIGLSILLGLASPLRAGDVNSILQFGGKVTESKDKLVIDGVTFVAVGKGDVPVIKLEKDEAKTVVLNNVKVFSNNATIDDLTGNGGIVAIDNSGSNSKVTVRNVHVLSRNGSVRSSSTANDTCAGLLCLKAGKRDTLRGGVSAAAVGRTDISASQGTRPDYRKIR